MSDWTDAREAAALEALGEAEGPVSAEEFAELMWPSTVGAGMSERAAAAQQARYALRPLLAAETAEKTSSASGVPLYAVAE